jgi:hypothetical protein
VWAFTNALQAIWTHYEFDVVARLLSDLPKCLYVSLSIIKKPNVECLPWNAPREMISTDA